MVLKALLRWHCWLAPWLQPGADAAGLGVVSNLDAHPQGVNANRAGSPITSFVRPGLKAPGYSTTPAEAGFRGVASQAYSADGAASPLMLFDNLIRKKANIV